MKLSSRAWLNIGLLIAAGLLALLVFVEPGKQAPVKHTVSTLQKSTIQRIHIQRQNQPDVLLQKRDNQWLMLQPYQYPANDFKVDSLLQLLNTESHAQYDLSGLTLAQYDLDKPRFRVSFNDEHAFEFGATEPMQQRRYLRHNNTMHLITDTFMYQVAATADAFLDHTLLPGSKRINKLILPKLTVELQDGKWQMTPTPKEFSADQITALIDTWRYAQALKVEGYTGKPVTPTIKLFREDDPQPIEYAMKVTDKEWILIRSDIKLQFHLSPDKRKEMLELPPKINTENNNAAPGKIHDHAH